MISTCALALASVLLAGGGTAPTKGSKLEQGTRAFVDGQFDAALRYLDQAVADSAADPAQLEKAQLLRAQCFAAQQNFARAEEAFAQALEANPDASLDPSRVDPTLVRMLDSVRARLTGTLTVTSVPTGASLFLDGKNAGISPQTLTVPIGKHKLEARWGEGPMTPTDVLVRARRDLRIEVIQAAAAPEATGVNPTTLPVRLVADARVTLEVPTLPGWPVLPGVDVGAALEFWYARLGLTARLHADRGLALRGALRLPVVDKFSVFGEASLPFLFRNNGLASGFALGVAAEYEILPWLAVYALIGGEGFWSNPGRGDTVHILGTIGVHPHVP